MSLRSSELFRPQPGEIVHCTKTGRRLGVVVDTVQGICMYVRANGTDSSYIWRFRNSIYPYGENDYRVECLNKLFYTWPDSVYRDKPTMGNCF